MSDHKADLPKLLKSLRKKLGLSQEELAQKLGVSFTSVNRWENQQTKPSKLARRQIEALRKEFDCQEPIYLEERSNYDLHYSTAVSLD